MNSAPQRQPPLLKRFAWRAAGAAACIAIAGMLIVRVRDDRAATRAANASRMPAVTVARVTREDLYREITVPAEFRPYNEVDLHAKVSGYVRQINVDIGDRADRRNDVPLRGAAAGIHSALRDRRDVGWFFAR